MADSSKDGSKEDGRNKDKERDSKKSSDKPDRKTNDPSKIKSSNKASGSQSRGSADGVQPSLLNLMAAPPPGSTSQEANMLVNLRAETKATNDKVDKMASAVQALTAIVQQQQQQFAQQEVVQQDDPPRIVIDDTEEDEELLEDYQECDGEENDEDEATTFDDVKVTDKFVIEKAREEPEALQVVLWESGRKVTDEYTEEDWKKLNVKGLVNKLTKHPNASTFAAHKAEPQLIDLKFKDRKERESQYVDLQNYTGAVGALSTNLLVLLQDEADKITNVVKDFDNPGIEIEDPRDEASKILKLMKQNLLESWAKKLSDITKISGATYSRILMLRRSQYIQVTGHWKGAKNLLKRLQPSREYLFGNKVSDLCKDLEVSSQLSPLARPSGPSGKFNPRFPSNSSYGYRANRGRGGSSSARGNRGRGGARGGRGSSSRVQQFEK